MFKHGEPCPSGIHAKLLHQVVDAAGEVFVARHAEAVPGVDRPRRPPDVRLGETARALARVVRETPVGQPRLAEVAARLLHRSVGLLVAHRVQDADRHRDHVRRRAERGGIPAAHLPELLGQRVLVAFVDASVPPAAVFILRLRQDLQHLP